MGNTLTVQDCTKRWKNLRDTFVREMRKTKKGKTGEKGPPYASKWPYFSTMLFLADSVKHRE